MGEYDRQTVNTNINTPAGPKEVIDHGASAKANVREVGKNLLHAVDPTNHFRSTWGQSNGSNFAAAGIMAGFKVLMLPWDLAREVVDIVALPFKVLKNGTDAVAHGVLAGVKPKQGASLD